jgi:hypothetical protein
MARKLLNGCIVSLFAFICPLSLIAAIGGGSLVSGASADLADVAVTVRAPSSVTLGEPFTVDVSVTNQAETNQTLDDIDLDAAILETFEILGAEPPFSHTSRDLFFQTYWFETEIGPGETLEVALEMVALETGTHAILVGVCINSPTSCGDYEIVIAVR